MYDFLHNLLINQVDDGPCLTIARSRKDRDIIDLVHKILLVLGQLLSFLLATLSRKMPGARF